MTRPSSPIRLASVVFLIALCAQTPRISWCQATPGEAVERTEQAEQEVAHEVGASLSHDSAAPGETVVLQIVFRNRGQEPVRDLLLERLDAPGFDRLSEERVPAPGKALAEGERAVFRMTLKVVDRRFGSRTLIATFAWRDGDGEMVRRAVVIVPPVTVVSRWSSARAPGWMLLLKGLGFPSALAFFGLLINSSLKNYAGKSQKARKELEDELEDRRRERSERLEKMRLLLSGVWKIAENHYLPIGSAILRLEKDWKRYTNKVFPHQKKDESTQCKQALDEVFVSMIVLLWRDQAFTHAVAGWIFQDRGGEDLISELWGGFENLVEARLGPPDDNGKREVERLLRDLDEQPRRAEVVRKLETLAYPVAYGGLSQESAKQWRKVRDHLETWMGEKPSTFQATILLLKAVQAVLLLETNRLYEPLYSGLPEDSTTKGLCKLGRDLDRYAEGLEEDSPGKEIDTAGNLAPKMLSETLRERAEEISHYCEQYECWLRKERKNRERALSAAKAEERS